MALLAVEKHCWLTIAIISLETDFREVVIDPQHRCQTHCYWLTWLALLYFWSRNGNLNCPEVLLCVTLLNSTRSDSWFCPALLIINRHICWLSLVMRKCALLTGLDVQVSDNWRIRETITSIERACRGSTCRGYRRWKSLHTWRHFTTEDFRCLSHTTSTGMQSLWNF